MKEIWKDIKGFEDWYEISNKGRVKSIDKRIIMKTNLSKSGYERLCLTKNGKSVHKVIHRLVAEAFIPNPNNYAQVNHKNGIKTDNRVENLEWCSASYNVKHAYVNNLKSNKKGIYNKLSKPIKQFDKGNNLIGVYGSIREAERKTGIKNQSIIQNLKGRYKEAGGYFWEYVKAGEIDSLLKERDRK